MYENKAGISLLECDSKPMNVNSFYYARKSYSYDCRGHQRIAYLGGHYVHLDCFCIVTMNSMQFQAKHLCIIHFQNFVSYILTIQKMSERQGITFMLFIEISC